MKKFIRYFSAVFLLTFSFSAIIAQAKVQPEIQTEILSRAAINNVLTDAVKKEFDISFPVFRVYRCTDIEGTYYLVLTENITKITSETDTLNDKVKALNLKIADGKLIKQWEINDFTIKPGPEYDVESSICFWTKFSELNDIDGDGTIDPVLVYGTSGLNGTDDGRIKILVFYKGAKIVINHQNALTARERSTQIDEAFYTLPIVIQKSVKDIVKRIEKNKLGIFSIDWNDVFKSHKTNLSDKY